jgi:uncharacterized protein
MKIGIISDIHENKANLLQAIDLCRQSDVSHLLCLGDMINPGIAQTIATCGIPTHGIWGNNDGDKVLITRLSLQPQSQLAMSDRTYDFVTLDGKRIFITHYPELAHPMALSGQYDLVAYGHDHQQFYALVEECHVVNPGEISGHLTGLVSLAIYDTVTDTVEFLTITNE